LLAKPTDPSIEGFDIVEFTAIRDLDMRPPIAAELEDAAAAGFTVETRYLGPVWRPEGGPSR
ncbi:MAG: hypothetical protein ACYC77_04710, partial [Coriobacteriia bacterium]